EQQAHLVQAHVALAVGGRLRELAEHDELGQRRHRPRWPPRRSAADRVDERGRELERQALVTIAVLVRAHVLVAGMAGEDRSGHQLEPPAPRAVAQAPLAAGRQVEAAVHLGERLVARPDGAAVIGHRDRRGPQDRRREHLHRTYRGWEPTATPRYRLAGSDPRSTFAGEDPPCHPSIARSRSLVATPPLAENPPTP